MTYSISEISAIISPRVRRIVNPDAPVRHLLNDSRSLVFPEDSLFFAIRTKNGDGHHFIAALYQRGIRNFVVEEMRPEYELAFADANFLVVSDSTAALQTLARHHRMRFDIPVIAITGSRGKTTVKEWLYQLMQADEEVLRSPRSFNSRIGVPLSLWELEPSTTLGIFEAGISRMGEMEQHRLMIAPTIAVITNVGREHDDGFPSLSMKAAEKARLAAGARCVIYNADDRNVSAAVGALDGDGERFTWSRRDPSAPLFIKAVVNMGDSTEIEYISRGVTATVTVPFVNQADIENAITSLAVMIVRGYSPDEIGSRMSLLKPVDTRLEVIDGVNDCQLLLDGYTSDLRSLAPALDFMTRRATANHSLTVILSDLMHGNRNTAALYKEVATLLVRKNVTHIIGIGAEISAHARYFPDGTRFFGSTDEFLADMTTSDFDHELILVKGAPGFGFHRIGERLEARQHETVLEVNLDAMMANYNFFKSFLKPETGIVAMVKASGYGAGSYELAKSLQSAGAAYLAVAAHDEGVDLRRAGITMPIMVLNPKVVNYPALFAYNLEPEIYSFGMLEEIIHEGEKCGVTDYPVHIKIDSGMHRLGFLREDMPRLTALLVGQNVVTPRSIFSHLAAADDPAEDDYTRMQFAYFDDCCGQLQRGFPDRHILRHILNSTGIVRFPQMQHDMVRLGIGLYGVATLSDGSMAQLRPVSSLHTVIISIKDWPEGTTIGYNRRGMLTRPSRIATVPVGYADGLDRHLGNGHTSFVINGHRCPTVGNICMDICMVDVTDCPDCKVGDRVEIFGDNVPAAELARILDTIPYEILTSVASRVKRVYFRE